MLLPQKIAGLWFFTAKTKSRSHKPIILKKTTDFPKESDKTLKEIWSKVRLQFFPEHTDIDDYTVNWSARRQKRTLASCNISQRRVLVAKEINSEDAMIWLEPLLYHEMCHAVIGLSVQKSNNKRLWHGAQFKELESRHPLTLDLDKWVKSGGWSKAVRSARARSSQIRIRAKIK